MTQTESLVRGESFVARSARNPQMQAAIDRLFMTRRIDLVQVEFPESALYELLRPVPTVFDAHNVEHHLLQRVARSATSAGKRGYNMLEARKVKRLEIAAWSTATMCVATSDTDAELMRGLTSTPVEIVPNGVDLDHFTPCDVEEIVAGNIVFIGAMRHQPNADGAVWYAQQVHPLVRRSLPGARFTIVGADPPSDVTALASESIAVTGQVDDVRPWLAEAQVVAVPLWSGGGTRLKILEAFASGRPVVSTSIGVEGIDARDGEHLLIADSAESFASAVVRLVQDRDLTARLVRAARQLVTEQYGWDAIGSRLVAAHEKAVSAFEESASASRPGRPASGG